MPSGGAAWGAEPQAEAAGGNQADRGKLLFHVYLPKESHLQIGTFPDITSMQNLVSLET